MYLHIYRVGRFSLNSQRMLFMFSMVFLSQHDISLMTTILVLLRSSFGVSSCTGERPAWFADVSNVLFRARLDFPPDLVLANGRGLVAGFETVAGFLSPSLSSSLLSFFFGAIVLFLNREITRQCSCMQSKRSPRLWVCKRNLAGQEVLALYYCCSRGRAEKEEVRRSISIFTRNGWYRLSLSGFRSNISERRGSSVMSNCSCRVI